MAATHQVSTAPRRSQDQPGQHQHQYDAGGEDRLHDADRLERQHDDLAGQPEEHEREPGQPGRIGQQGWRSHAAPGGCRELASRRAPASPGSAPRCRPSQTAATARFRRRTRHSSVLLPCGRGGGPGATAGVSAAASATSAHACAGQPNGPNRPSPHGRTADSGANATMPPKAIHGSHAPGAVRPGDRGLPPSLARRARGRRAPPGRPPRIQHRDADHAVSPLATGPLSRHLPSLFAPSSLVGSSQSAAALWLAGVKDHTAMASRRTTASRDATRTR